MKRVIQLFGFLMMTSLAATAAQAGEGDMHRMQDIREKMHQQMQEIHNTKDDAKRERLMDEHMQTMQEGMDRMHGMDGNMEQRMEMMQMMMEHMIKSRWAERRHDHGKMKR